MVTTAPPPSPARRRMSRFLVGMLSVFLVFCVIGTMVVVALLGLPSSWGIFSEDRPACVPPSSTATAASPVLAMTYSAGGLLVETGTSLAVLDPVTGRILREIKDAKYRRYMATSDDGKFVVAAGGEPGYLYDVVAVFDTSTGKEVKDFVQYEEGASLSAVAISPDGKLVATATSGFKNEDPRGSVRLWDVRTGRVRATLSAGSGVLLDSRDSVAFSADGKVLAAVAGGMIYLWDTKTGRVLRELEPDRKASPSIRISPDGRYVAVREMYGKVIVVEVESGRVATTVTSRIGGIVMDMRFSADSGSIVTLGAGVDVMRTSLTDGKTLVDIGTCTGLQGDYGGGLVAPDGKAVLHRVGNGLSIVPVP